VPVIDSDADIVEQALAAMVFGPAGITSTFYPAPGAAVTEAGYDTLWAGPAGAAWATPRDLFLTALFDGSLLSAKSLAAMTSTTAVATGAPWRKPGYGLGLMIDGEYRTFGHGGSGPGYTSAAFITPEPGRSAAVITRTSVSGDPTDLALQLLQIDT
jgi:hypothetical protein